MMVLFIIALLGASGEITAMQSGVMAAAKVIEIPIRSATFTANVKVGKSVKLSEIVSKEVLAKCNLKPVYVTRKRIVSYGIDANLTNFIIKGKKKGKTTLFFAEKGRSISGQKYSKVLFSVTVNVK